MARSSTALVLGLTAAFAASVVFGQTVPPAPKAGSSARITPGKRTAATGAAKGVTTPDPDLLDGSAFEAEKKPMFGMISDIELAGSEQKTERVGGSSQPPGGEQAPSGMPQPAGGGPGEPPAGPPPPAGGQPGAEIEEGKDDRDSGGPQGKAEGIAVKNLENTEGAAAQSSAQATPPRDMQIGDASLQIQTVKQQPEVVGTESTSTQQSDKKMPQGKQTDNRNRGAEKGRVMPKGL